MFLNRLKNNTPNRSPDPSKRERKASRLIRLSVPIRPTKQREPFARRNGSLPSEIGITSFSLSVREIRPHIASNSSAMLHSTQNQKLSRKSWKVNPTRSEIGAKRFFREAMALVLHAGKTNKNAYKTLIAAEYTDVKVELVSNFEMGVSNKTPEFLKMNPIGKVPVLETPDGPVFESNAIARYVTRLKADNPLYGSSLIDYAHIEQWIDLRHGS
ncbi:hypothetical protein SLA2020_447020 [Shorea laevis]